jgi:BlaI family transcriptional regulator, penicillinase repressor
MTKAEQVKPTEAELAILNVLWEQGACTVRQVQNQVQEERGTGYTTTLKLMQIMFEKGLLKRDESTRSHVYTAAITRQKIQKALVTKLVDQLFDGSAQQLIMQALSSRKASLKELAEIRALIDSLESKGACAEV